MTVTVEMNNIGLTSDAVEVEPEQGGPPAWWPKWLRWCWPRCCAHTSTDLPSTPPSTPPRPFRRYQLGNLFPATDPTEWTRRRLHLYRRMFARLQLPDDSDPRHLSFDDIWRLQVRWRTMLVNDGQRTYHYALGLYPPETIEEWIVKRNY